ncbi:ankyrin repeat domain-containing protein [Gordonia sp. OPL2]|uniref:ankyrin repeat domain-containing protein n=1 Tax=Gordonia sp. OPL2 TaxID=2486274 RepID=UPI00165657C9|nr:ankyrin repeat domain-containing protein [Gordonia sp. OPL2]ROZ87358.1 ankyrin repeat domain-containing protein [Gordonia sp. OPL2]
MSTSPGPLRGGGRLIALASIVIALAVSGCDSVRKVIGGADAAEYFDSRTVALIEAARAGDADRARDLIADGVDVDARGNDHDPRRTALSPLQLAVEFESPRTVTTLLEVGADARLTRGSSYNAMTYALLRDRPASVDALLAFDPTLADAEDRLGGNALHTAVRHGRDDSVRKLIDAGADLDSVQPLSGQTPLFTAAGVQNVDHCLLLIRAGADGGHRDNRGATFLRGLYLAQDSIRTGEFLRKRTSLEAALRLRGFPVETGR